MMKLNELCERFGCVVSLIQVMSFDDEGNIALDCNLYENVVLCSDDEVIFQV